MAHRFSLVSAVHLLLVQNDQVLLLRRFQTGYEDGNYSVVAGHLEGNEEVVAAMIREAREEVGILIAPQDMRVTGIMHRKSNDERIDFFLTATRWQGEIVNQEPEKCDALTWFPLTALPDNIVPYVRRAIELIQQHEDIWFDSFGWH